MNSMDWWPWWISTVVGVALATVAVFVVLRARTRTIRRGTGGVAVLALAAAVAAPFVMGSTSNSSTMMGSSSSARAGGKIIFVRDGALFSVRLETGKLTKLGNGSIVNPASDPEWSPDDKSIVFTRACALFVTAADGKRTKKVSLPASQCVKHPSFSPDGGQIVFADQTGSSAAPLFVVRTNGKGLRQLTQKGAESEFEDKYPAWSPDGSKIAFGRLRPGTAPPDLAIFVVDADGENMHLVRPDSGSKLENMPVWSPDGRRFAYGRLGVVPMTSRIDMMSIYVGSVDGKEHALVSRVAMGDGDMYPAWSPDGSMVAFSSGGGGIGVMRTDGSGRRMLTRAWGDAMPDWTTKG